MVRDVPAPVSDDLMPCASVPVGDKRDPGVHCQRVARVQRVFGNVQLFPKACSPVPIVVFDTDMMRSVIIFPKGMKAAFL